MSTSAIPLFGRAWKLTVKYLEGEDLQVSQIISQSSWDPEALKITFEILENTVGSPYWYADINIFNLNEPTQQNVLWKAVWVTLEAGFQSGPTKSSIIWDGPVLQVLFDRLNVVDGRICLHCLATIPEIENNVVNLQVGPQTTQAQAVSLMMQSIGAPPVIFGPKAQQVFEQKKYPRGNTFFGKGSKYLAELASDSFMSFWQDGQQAYISEMTSDTVQPNLVYSPALPPNYTPSQGVQGVTYSILDTPRQTPFGVIFRVLLDPRLHVVLPPLLVQLQNVVISQLKAYLGEILNPVDSSGLCVVAQVRHVGDSRGDDWYTEVTAYWRNYTTNLLDGVFAALQNGGG